MAKASLMRKVASAVAKLEGKKKQTSVGNIAETIARTMEYLEMNDLDGSILKELQIAAKKRLKKKNAENLAEVMNQIKKGN